MNYAQKIFGHNSSKIHQKNVKLVPKYNPAGSRNPAGFTREIPQSRGIEKSRDLVNCTQNRTWKTEPQKPNLKNRTSKPNLKTEP